VADDSLSPAALIDLVAANLDRSSPEMAVFRKTRGASDELCHGDRSPGWARAGDRLADVLYNKLRLAKEIQLNMWSHFCVRAACRAGPLTRR
jgi:hypothetical protein